MKILKVFKECKKNLWMQFENSQKIFTMEFVLKTFDGGSPQILLERIPFQVFSRDILKLKRSLVGTPIGIGWIRITEKQKVVEWIF